jgi:hypothetical protein
MATLVTIDGTLTDAEGANLTGTITFRPTQPLYDLDGNRIVGTAPVTATLSSGQFTVTIYATDDATTAPDGATYTISEDLAGADGSAIERTYRAEVPSADTSLRYEDLVEVTAQPVYSYATTAGLAALEARLGGTSAVTFGDTTLPRSAAMVDTVPTVSGTLLLSYFTATRAEDINRLVVVTGGTGSGATPSLIRAGLYTVNASTGALTLVASSVSDTAALDTPGQAVEWALSADYTTTAEQRYAVGLLVVTGAATPTLVGLSSELPGSELAVEPRMAATLAAQTNLPASATAASLTDTPYVLYARTRYQDIG